MSLTLALAVGMNSSLLAIQRSVGQSDGCHITSVDSIKEAIVQLRDGDFDLILLDQSIPVEDRESLTFLIRTSRSRIPVVCVTDDHDGHDSLAGAATSNGPDDLLPLVGEVLAKRASTHATVPDKRLGKLLHFPGPR